MPAEYVFDQLMGFLDLLQVDLHTRQDFRISADEIVRLLMCHDVHKKKHNSLVTDQNLI